MEWVGKFRIGRIENEQKILFQCNLELDELDFALMSVILVTSEKKRNRFKRTVKESLKSQHVS